MRQQLHTTLARSFLPQIECTGDCVSLRFRNQVFPNREFLAECRETLDRLLDEHRCTVAKLDLSDVQVIGPSMLKLLLGLNRRGLEVQVTNAAPLVREVLSVTRLDTLFPIVELA